MHALSLLVPRRLAFLSESPKGTSCGATTQSRTEGERSKDCRLPQRGKEEGPFAIYCSCPFGATSTNKTAKDTDGPKAASRVIIRKILTSGPFQALNQHSSPWVEEVPTGTTSKRGLPRRGNNTKALYIASRCVVAPSGQSLLRSPKVGVVAPSGQEQYMPEGAPKGQRSTSLSESRRGPKGGATDCAAPLAAIYCRVPQRGRRRLLNKELSARRAYIADICPSLSGGAPTAEDRDAGGATTKRAPKAFRPFGGPLGFFVVYWQSQLFLMCYLVPRRGPGGHIKCLGFAVTQRVRDAHTPQSGRDRLRRSWKGRGAYIATSQLTFCLICIIN